MYDLDKKIFYIEQNYMKGEFTPLIHFKHFYSHSPPTFLPCFILESFINVQKQY